jgi:hypothetical protein
MLSLRKCKGDTEQVILVKRILRRFAPIYKPDPDRVGFKFAPFAMMAIVDRTNKRYAHVSPDERKLRAELTFIGYIDWERRQQNTEALERALHQSLLDRLKAYGIDDYSAGILSTFTFVELRLRGENLVNSPEFMDQLVKLANLLHRPAGDLEISGEH